MKPETALEVLNFTLAGEHIENAPYTIFQVLNHMIYWQDFLIDVLKGKNPAAPEHAEGSWPPPSGETHGKLRIEHNGKADRFCLRFLF